MEQEIILEGIHAMLEEIRDNMKKNPGQEMINSKLIAIKKTCNDLAEKKLVTEDIMASFISYVLKQMIEMNKKQDEKIDYWKENYSLLESQVKMLENEINLGLIEIRKILELQQNKQSVLKKILNFLN